jgi:hypothetical protein
MTSALTEKYGMMASIATIIAIFAVMFTAPSLGLAVAAAAVVINGLIMVDVARA